MSTSDSEAWAAWDKTAEQYSVHRETRETNVEFTKRGYKADSELDLEGLRSQFHDVLTRHGTHPFDGKVDDVLIPSKNNKSGIPVRVYTPSSVGKNPLIMIYIHGGGLVSGSMVGYDGVVRRIAAATKAIMVSVEYRLLPNEEDRFSPFNDCVEAARWVFENKTQLGGQPSSNVGIVGDSAGGQIAVAVTSEVQGFVFQILIYPVASFDFTTKSCVDFHDTPNLNTVGMQRLISFFLPQVPDAAQRVRFNPAIRENVESSPPTLVMVAELDPLTDGAIEYSKKLEKAGVHTEVVVIKGFPHGFLCFPVEAPTGVEQALTHIDAFVKSFGAQE